jgi:carboxyl-terminal processing protease
MIAVAPLVLLWALAAPSPSECQRDVDYALDAIEQQCAAVLATKGIDWPEVAVAMRALAAQARTEADHYATLLALLARLRDGHAAVLPAEGGRLPKLEGAAAAAFEGLVEPGLHLGFDAKTSRIVVTAAWGAAERAGFAPGMIVERVGKAAAKDWLATRVAHWRERLSFSTDHHARAYALARGLAHPRGTELAFRVKPVKGGARTLELKFQGDEGRRPGPLVPPAGAIDFEGLRLGTTAGGFAWIHVPKIEPDLPERLDRAFAALDREAAGAGLVLDLRGNTGGGCDHEQLLGVFVPRGKTFDPPQDAPVGSFGENPYTGRLVVIVDAFVFSAGETVAGTFKEDGRGWLLGDSRTAGASGSKAEIALPSGRYVLRVVVRSHKQRFNGGRGIEGIGVEPHEIVPLDPALLARGIDPLLERADEVLRDYPTSKVAFERDRRNQ